MTSELSTGKTIFILAVVVGCFAVLWPKVFQPMFSTQVQNPATQAELIWRDPANAHHAKQLCYLLEEQHGPLSSLGKWSEGHCLEELKGICGVTITEKILEGFRLSMDKSNLTKCLQQKFDFSPQKVSSVAPPLVRSRIYNSKTPHPHIRPERPTHVHTESMHPALREKGRTLPQRTIEKQARPGPMPGIRPPMGGGGHMVPPQSKGVGAMGIIMPLYTVGIVVFFIYTIMKVVFKKGAEEDKTPKLKDFHMDPEYRKYVFAEEYLDSSNSSHRDSQRRQEREISKQRRRQDATHPETKIGKSECRKITIAMNGILSELDYFSHEIQKSEGHSAPDGVKAAPISENIDKICNTINSNMPSLTEDSAIEAAKDIIEADVDNCKTQSENPDATEVTYHPIIQDKIQNEPNIPQDNPSLQKLDDAVIQSRNNKNNFLIYRTICKPSSEGQDGKSDSSDPFQRHSDEEFESVPFCSRNMFTRHRHRENVADPFLENSDSSEIVCEPDNNDLMGIYDTNIGTYSHRDRPQNRLRKKTKMTNVNFGGFEEFTSSGSSRVGRGIPRRHTQSREYIDDNSALAETSSLGNGSTEDGGLKAAEIENPSTTEIYDQEIDGKKDENFTSVTRIIFGDTRVENVGHAKEEEENDYTEEMDDLSMSVIHTEQNACTVPVECSTIQKEIHIEVDSLREDEQLQELELELDLEQEPEPEQQQQQQKQQLESEQQQQPEPEQLEQQQPQLEPEQQQEQKLQQQPEPEPEQQLEQQQQQECIKDPVPQDMPPRSPHLQESGATEASHAAGSGHDFECSSAAEETHVDRLNMEASPLTTSPGKEDKSGVNAEIDGSVDPTDGSAKTDGSIDPENE